MSKKRTSIALVTGGALLGAVMTLSVTALAEREPNAPLPLMELRTFAEVFGRIKQDYVEPVEDKTLINEAINGMLTGLDPHSAYLDAEAFKELREGTQGEFGGLGLEIGSEDGLIKIVAPIEDTPAFRAGLRSGDYIVKIDDTSVRGMSTNDAVKKMRGKPGTRITLTISRKNENRLFNVQITRAIIKIRSVRWKLLESGYGYVRIAQFQERTVENLADGLLALHRENKQPLKGLVLDLRDDPGGLLDAAVGVSAAFLPQESLVVYTEGRAPDAKMRLTALPENYVRSGTGRDPLAALPEYIRTMPLVVLVNAGSASASEIVAGALQDHQRAKVVGVQTFGKGSVQTILPLGVNGGIKLTTARYFTPNGRSIQAKGIEPDIHIEEPPPPPRPVDQSQPVIRVREADLGHHLSNPEGEQRPAPKSATPEVSPSSAPKPEPVVNPRDPNPSKDPQLAAALDILKGKPVHHSKDEHSHSSPSDTSPSTQPAQ